MRLLRLGSGSVIGAHVTLRLAPNALRDLAAGKRIAVVSGTNGKSTTTAMLAAAVTAGGARVVSNVEGANLRTGVVAALSHAGDADTAVLEIDELALARLLVDLPAPVVTLLNLSRDQLDRFGEVRSIADAWRTALADKPDAVVVANADDPLVAYGAGTAARTRWVGVGLHWRSDASSCPACGGRIRFDEPDGWACERGDLRRPPVVDLPVAVTPGVPGRHNVGNAAMALIAAGEVGVAPEVAAAAITSVRSVAGRYLEVRLGATTARLLLAKNPAGWEELLALVEHDDRPLLLAINARIADGKDPSWLWDVPYERLRGRRVVAAGDRATDLAVRLRYAEVDCELWTGSLAERLRRYEAPEVDVLANYTAFADLVKELEV